MRCRCQERGCRVWCEWHLFESTTTGCQASSVTVRSAIRCPTTVASCFVGLGKPLPVSNQRFVLRLVISLFESYCFTFSVGREIGSTMPKPTDMFVTRPLSRILWSEQLHETAIDETNSTYRNLAQWRAKPIVITSTKYTCPLRLGTRIRSKFCYCCCIFKLYGDRGRIR